MKNTSLTDISLFLTDHVLKRAFIQKTGSNEDIHFVEVSRASKPGDGMLSAVYRVRVRGGAHEASFIAKALVRDKVLRNSLNCEKYFKRESLFFMKILPVLIDLQKSLGAKERIQNSVPVCYAAHCDGEHDFILMEDMFYSGYRPISEEVTIWERDFTLKALAHLHAVSIGLREKAPNEFNDVTNELTELYYTEEGRDWYSKYLSMALEYNRNVISEFETPNSIYHKKFFESISGDVYGEMIKLTASDSEHRAIMHGDAWCANFLCSENKAVAIDFQAMRCASPATELAYFILICSGQCRQASDFNEAVDVYYAGLKYYLEDMGFCSENVFSRQQLDEELKKYGRFGLLACLTSFLLISNSGDKFDTLSSVSADDINDIIPLEKLWKLTDYKEDEDKMRLVNAVRVVVDVGLM